MDSLRTGEACLVFGVEPLPGRGARESGSATLRARVWLRLRLDLLCFKLGVVVSVGVVVEVVGVGVDMVDVVGVELASSRRALTEILGFFDRLEAPDEVEGWDWVTMSFF